MSNALTRSRTEYDLIDTRAGLRLIHLRDDDVCFIEIDDLSPFHMDDLVELIEVAEQKVGFTLPTHGVFIEEAWLFGDIFGDRVVLIRDERI